MVNENREAYLVFVSFFDFSGVRFDPKRLRSLSYSDRYDGSADITKWVANPRLMRNLD